MSEKQAAVLTDQRVSRALRLCRNERERAMFLLSVRAGLRAKEIAGLTWGTYDAETRTLRLTVTKGDKVRTVPVKADLATALAEYRATLPEHKTAADANVFTNTHANKGAALTPNAVACWFKAFYEKAGWQGYSSHSGRRTFITKVARKIGAAGGSMRDVQALAGHSDMRTTARYIDTDPDAQRRVVDLI